MSCCVFLTPSNGLITLLVPPPPHVFVIVVRGPRNDTSPRELIASSRVLFVVVRGIVARDGRVLVGGSVFGHDFMVSARVVE